MIKKLNNYRISLLQLSLDGEINNAVRYTYETEDTEENNKKVNKLIDDLISLREITNEICMYQDIVIDKKFNYLVNLCYNKINSLHEKFKSDYIEYSLLVHKIFTYLTSWSAEDKHSDYTEPFEISITIDKMLDIKHNLYLYGEHNILSKESEDKVIHQTVVTDIENIKHIHNLYELNGLTKEKSINTINLFNSFEDLVDISFEVSQNFGKYELNKMLSDKNIDDLTESHTMLSNLLDLVMQSKGQIYNTFSLQNTKIFTENLYNRMALRRANFNYSEHLNKEICIIKENNEYFLKYMDSNELKTIGKIYLTDNFEQNDEIISYVNLVLKSSILYWLLTDIWLITQDENLKLRLESLRERK